MAESGEYSERARDVVVYGSVALALAMAQETGVVRVLCDPDTCQPLTAQQVADKARLKERYVREMLGALTSSGLVQLAPGTGGSDEVEAAYLVAKDNQKTFRKIACDALFVSDAARQFSGVKRCVALDGPDSAPYEGDFEKILDALGTENNEDILNSIMAATPGLQQQLESGIEVAEIGAGTGLFSRLLAARYPKSRFTLTDVEKETLEKGRRKAEEQGLRNVSTEVADACSIPESWVSRFDWILALNVIHVLPNKHKVLEGIAKSLKPGGDFTIAGDSLSSFVRQNVGSKRAAFYYSLCTFFSTSDAPPPAEREDMRWGNELVARMVEKAGLRLQSSSETDIMGCLGIFVCKKPE